MIADRHGLGDVYVAGAGRRAKSKDRNREADGVAGGLRAGTRVAGPQPKPRRRPSQGGPAKSVTVAAASRVRGRVSAPQRGRDEATGAGDVA